jgi:hypothetical protein
MKDNTMTRPITIWILFYLQALLGLGALWGGMALMLAPEGSIIENLMQMPKNMLAGTPFSNYLIPGILLFTFVGIYPVAVAYSLWKRPLWKWPNLLNPFKPVHWSWAGSLAAGVILIIWITVQVILFRQMYFPHYLYIEWGTLIMLLTLLPKTRL